jgi:SNF2 family DNA or RNA helicase
MSLERTPRPVQVVSESDEDSDSDSEVDLAAPRRWLDVSRTLMGQEVIYRRYGNSDEYKVDVELDESFCGANDIDGLKTTLFPHQKPVVQAMIDAENCRNNKMMLNMGYHGTKLVAVSNSAGVLSEPVGSGKTVDVLALVLSQKYPKALQDIGILNLHDDLGSKRPTLVSVVRKKFKNILQPTIVFAGVSVVDQWVNAVKTFTNLRYFAVYQVRDLQLLIDMMISKKINNYDIVIVKNGTVTRPVKFPASITMEWKNRRQTPYIYNIISNVRNYCWARVVIDDFDTIKLPHNAGLINALFTWYISSTQKTISTRPNKNVQFRRTSDMLMHSNFSCGNIMANDILFKALNIRNNPKFIERTNNLPAPRFYAYVFENPNDRYMGLMGVMGDNQATQIMEMLNGDAFETAAEAAGVKSTSVADIFQKILGAQFASYEFSVKVVAFVDANEDADMRAPYSSNPDQEDTYTKKNLLEFREPRYNYPGLRGLLTNTREEYVGIKEKSGMAIQRVKDNISEGSCPICYSEFNEGDTVILKCCGVVVCSGCCFDAIFPGKRMAGQCSNCRQKLSMLDIIYMNSEFNLESITKDRMDDFSKPNEAGSKAYKKPRAKIDAILDIIRGIAPEEQKEVDVRVHNLMKGLGALPDGAAQKVLIFASFDETLKQIEKDLTENEIKFMRLGGSHSEITKTADEFNSAQGSQVMIINSTKHCSGLNLQTATDLIFAHKIIDKDIQSQVAGRIQRMGRTTQARIHFMLYKNEFEWMTMQNELRVINGAQ